MRLQHWIVPAIGLILTLSGSREAAAQFDPTRVVPAEAKHYAGHPALAQPFPYVDPQNGARFPVTPAGYESSAPAPYGPANVGWPNQGPIPSHHTVSVAPDGSRGLPPGIQPWPQISPYEHRFNEHYRSEGLWFEETNDSPRSWYFSADAFLPLFRTPKDRLLGSENVNPDINGSGILGNNRIAFEPLTAREVFSGWERQPGVMFRLGFNDPDDTGLEVESYFVDYEDHQGFGDPSATANNPNNLSAFNPGLSLDDGSTGGIGTNTNSFVDKRVVMTYQIQTAGVDLTRWTSPIVKRRHLKIRRLYGIRYMEIDERFTYQGSDSGLSYIFNPTTGNPFPGTFGTITPPTSLEFKSSTESFLTGPEIGLQVHMGGDKFLLRTESKLGLLANHEIIHLEGQGLGNQFIAGYDPTNSFSRERKHTHLSPLFEQSVNFDMKVMSLIPFVKKMRIFEHAKVRAGYTFLVAFEVARPTDSVVYVAPPVNPGIKVNRTDWYYSAWNFGVEWTR